MVESVCVCGGGVYRGSVQSECVEMKQSGKVLLLLCEEANQLSE